MKGDFAYHFALSLHGKRSHSDFRTLSFFPEKMILRKEGDEFLEIAYGDLQALWYVHGSRMGHWARMLGGSWLAGNEPWFRVETAGKVLEVGLELDVQYRQNELLRLFRDLYLLGVPLRERLSSQLPAFLGKPCDAAELEGKIRDLGAKNKGRG